jgi:hypothetical protein
MHVRCKGTCKMHRNDSYFPYVIFGVRAVKSFKPGTGLNLEILHGKVTSSDELFSNVSRQVSIICSLILISKKISLWSSCKVLATYFPKSYATVY